ncbi:MAG: hypothetical protein IJ343_00025 [Clostridia bacterium]|nr:hypothetical protein [Clostridia bacterium]
MTRTFLAVCAGLLCGLAGFRHAGELRGNSARLHAWTDALRRLRLLLTEGALSLPEVLRAAGTELHGPDRLLYDVADRLIADPLLSVPEAFDQACPPLAERSALLRLADGISHGSLEARILACEQSEALIGQLASEASANAERNAKLWQTLGWTGGICLTLILI